MSRDLNRTRCAAINKNGLSCKNYCKVSNIYCVVHIKSKFSNKNNYCSQQLHNDITSALTLQKCISYALNHRIIQRDNSSITNNNLETQIVQSDNSKDYLETYIVQLLNNNDTQ